MENLDNKLNEVAMIIEDLLNIGYTLREIGAIAGVKSVQTVANWLSNPATISYQAVLKLQEQARKDARRIKRMKE